MTALQLSQIEQFQADIAGIEQIIDAAIVATKSRDYFWYSPILTSELDGKVGDIVVKPRTQEEVMRVASIAASVICSMPAMSA